MSELRSALDQLRSEPLGELPDARAEADFVELQRAAELLEAELLRRLADLDRRACHQRDGHVSAASWLATTFRMSWGAPRHRPQLAPPLEGMPSTLAAL